MNLRTFLPVLTLVVGLGAGMMLTNSFSSSKKSDQDEQSTVSKKSQRTASSPNASDPGDGPSLNSSSPDKVSVGSLDSLINLLDESHSSFPPAEFFAAIEGLSVSEISHFIDGLETSFLSDSRSYRLRETLFKHWASIDPQGALAKTKTLKNKNIRSSALGTVAGVIARNDPAQATELVLAMNGGNARNSALQQVVYALSIDDPASALDLLERAKTNYTHLYQNTFSNWAKTDPLAAMAAAEKIQNRNGRQQAFNGIARTLAVEDPDRAWEFANSLKGNNRQNALAQVASQIVLTDPEKAIALVEAASDGQDQSELVRQFTSNWMRSDPEAAFAWMENLPLAQKQRTLRSTIWSLVQYDPEKASKLLESMPLSSQTEDYYSNLVGQWAQIDPKAALVWVQGLPPGQARQSAIQNYISNLGQNDPIAAARLLEKEPLNQRTNYQVGSLVGQWAATDPEAAFAWLETFPMGEKAHQQAMANAISNLANNDIQTAAKYTMQIEESAGRKDAVQNLLRTWGHQDFEGAKAWALANLDLSEQVSAFKSLVGSLSYQQPQAAKDLLADLSAGMTPEETQKEFGNSIQQIAGYWARNEPQEAAAWALSFSSPDIQVNALSNVIDQWSDFDTEGAANFVLTLDEGKLRDSATSSLISDLKRTDPEAAFLWAESVNDPSQRDTLIKQTIRNWIDTDRDAARLALQNAEVSDATRKVLLKSLDEE